MKIFGFFIFITWFSILSAGEDLRPESATGQERQNGTITKMARGGDVNLRLRPLYPFYGLEAGKTYRGSFTVFDDQQDLHTQITFQFTAASQNPLVSLMRVETYLAFRYLLQSQNKPLYVGLMLEDQVIEEMTAHQFVDNQRALAESVLAQAWPFTEVSGSRQMKLLPRGETGKTLFCALPAHSNLCKGTCENGCYATYCPGYSACGFSWICRANVVANYNLCMFACDYDGDGHNNGSDNCPCQTNNQADCDGDGIGNSCDSSPWIETVDGEISIFSHSSGFYCEGATPSDCHIDCWYGIYERIKVDNCSTITYRVGNFLRWNVVDIFDGQNPLATCQ